MKKNLLILLPLLIFVFVQCREDTSQQPAFITGTWKWVYTYKDIPLSSTNPATPANTGIQEILVFYSNGIWEQLQNSVRTDSGIYTIGHRHYTTVDSCLDYFDNLGQIHLKLCSTNYDYDSISFYKNNNTVGWDAYEILHNDTLAFMPGLADRFSSYMLPYNGSKWYVKQ